MRKKSDPKFTRSMMMLIPLTTEFGRRGGNVKAVLARNKLPLEALTNPAMLIDAAACYAAIEDMAESLGDRYFAARVAEEAARKGTPSLRTAARHAKTLGGFLSRVVMEVAAQANNVRYVLSTTAESAGLQVNRMVKVPGPTTQADAIGVTLYVTLFKLGLGPTFDPNRILVNVPNTSGIPKGLLPKKALLRSEINGLRISFPPQWLWAPFALDWDMPETPRGEFGPAGAAEATFSYFRNVLKDNIGHHDLPLNRFAAICGLHPRHLQRILATQGTSYRQMKDEVRRSITEDLLANSSIPIAQIAQRVGLSGPSALDRAFKQWTGKTPTSFRVKSTEKAKEKSAVSSASISTPDPRPPSVGRRSRGKSRKS